MTKLGIIISFVLLSIPIFGQEHFGDPTAVYTKKQYKKDFHQLVDLIVENHPKVYSFISKKEFKRQAKEKSKEITDSTSIGQFLWICEEVASSVKCGHTFIWWPNEFGLIPDALLFPVETWSQDFRLYITDTRNNSDKVAAGSEILTINDVGVATLIKQMYGASPADGNNDPWKRHKINRTFKSLCPMYFNYPEHYTVTVKTNDAIKTIQLDKYQWKEESSAPISSCSKELCLDIDSVTKTGILTIKTFNYYQDKFAEFKTFIDSSFEQINSQGIEKLIIDLRGNQGGDSYCGSYLIEHFANKPYCYWSADNNAGWQQDLRDTIVPNANRFKGTSYVLINGGCFSTSGHVCSLIKENHFGILVGEESGGTYTCNGSRLIGELTHTKLTYRIPRTIFFTSATSFPEDRGILPDVQIKRTLNDILEHKDPEMKYVLEQSNSE